jgi:DnaJ-class molecular chaperone
MKKLKLKSGEVICDKCEGKGIIISRDSKIPTVYTCIKCYGKGKLDWVDNATRKNTLLGFEIIEKEYFK